MTLNSSVVAVGTINIAKVAPGLFRITNASGQGVAAAVIFNVSVTACKLMSQCRNSAAARGFLDVDLGPASDIVYLLLNGTGLRGRTSAGNISVSLGALASRP